MFEAVLERVARRKFYCHTFARGRTSRHARIRSAYVARMHAVAKFFKNARIVIEALLIFHQTRPLPLSSASVGISRSLPLFLSLSSTCGTREIYLYLGPPVFSTCRAAVQQTCVARKNRKRTGHKRAARQARVLPKRLTGASEIYPTACNNPSNKRFLTFASFRD